MGSTDSEGVFYLTPSEVCQRWRIDARTLDKIDLPWIQITPRVRRVSFAVVQRVEVSRGYRRPST